MGTHSDSSSGFKNLISKTEVRKEDTQKERLAPGAGHTRLGHTLKSHRVSPRSMLLAPCLQMAVLVNHQRPENSRPRRKTRGSDAPVPLHGKPWIPGLERGKAHTHRSPCNVGQ